MDLIRSHVMVCGGTNCSSSASGEIIREFERQIAEKGLEKEIKVVRTGCFGMCEAGPVVIIYPEGAFYARMTVENVTRIVDEHLVKGRVVKELLYKEAEDRGMTRDEFDSALADSGLTVESQVDSVLALFDVSTLLSDVESELDSGKYKLEDGRLYLAETDGSFTQADSIGCTVSGSTMQWTDDQGALADLETELGVSPDLSWTKQ